MDDVNRLADFAFADQLVAAFSRLGEEMVQVAAKIDLFLRSQTDHLPGFADIVRNRLFDQDILACRQRFHSRNIVPAAILVTRCRDIDNIEIRNCREHILKRIECRDAILGGGGVGAIFFDITDGDEICQFICLVNIRMRVANATHSNQSDFESHVSFLLFSDRHGLPDMSASRDSCSLLLIHHPCERSIFVFDSSACRTS